MSATARGFFSGTGAPCSPAGGSCASAPAGGSSPPHRAPSPLLHFGRSAFCTEDRTVCRASAGEERRWRQEQPASLLDSLDTFYESYHESSSTGSDYCNSSMTDVGYSAWDCTPGSSSFDVDEEDEGCSCNPALECCDSWEPPRPHPNTSSSTPINVGDRHFMGQASKEASVRTRATEGQAGATASAASLILPNASYRRQTDPQERTFNATVRHYLHAAQVGDIHSDMNQPQQAEESYTAALELHLIAMAVLYMKRAAAHAKVAVQAEAGTSQELSWQSCLADANQAISLDPSMAVARLHAGEALLGLGRPNDAAVCLASGLKLEPSNAMLTKALQRAEDLLPKNNIVNLTKQPLPAPKMARAEAAAVKPTVSA